MTPVRTHVRLRPRPSGLPSPAFVTRIVRSTLKRERRTVAGEINVIFVDIPAIKKLNKKFLNETGDTDVIAFPYDADDTFGDVYIAAPVAARNARRFSDTVDREMVRLVVHGVLHLLGHDDHKAGPRERMWKIQEALVNALRPVRKHP